MSKLIEGDPEEVPVEPSRSIVCAAFAVKSHGMGYGSLHIFLGVRHLDKIMADAISQHCVMTRQVSRDVIANGVQGFVDNKGKFLTREEAWEVASKAGQIKRRVGGDEGRLFSENLY